ncbi:hypothetical protein Avbf_13997 [Armadillidium vulgare]|nr:hypothetical protein Avbf_13997 [Armadillidium vulgare]
MNKFSEAKRMRFGMQYKNTMTMSQLMSQDFKILQNYKVICEFVLKKSEKASEEEEEESPAEVLTSLEKLEESSSRRSSNMELSPPSGDATTVPMN